MCIIILFRNFKSVHERLKNIFQSLQAQMFTDEILMHLKPYKSHLKKLGQKEFCPFVGAHCHRG